jgi:hypothetical protein
MRHGQIVSHAPGRIRVRLEAGQRSPAVLDQIEHALGRKSGVASVSTNARTGSILVYYDEDILSKDDLTAMLSDVGVAALESGGADEASRDRGRGGRAVADHSSGAVSVLDAVTDLDHWISRLTGGKLDLKLLVPAGLGLLALRQIALNGVGLGQMPGYVLLWYTFDSFYKLHQRKTAQFLETVAEEVIGDDVDVSTGGRPSISKRDA